MRFIQYHPNPDGRPLSRTESSFPSPEKLALRRTGTLGTLLVAAIMVGCNQVPVVATNQSESGTAQQDAGANVPSRPKPFATSIVQLIASPDRFDGSDVLVGGYLYVEKSEEVDATLVSNPDDALRGLGVGVEVAFSQCGDGAPRPIPEEEIGAHHRRFVRVRGKFVAGTGGPSPGTICSIQEVVDVPEPTEAELRRFCPKEGIPGVCARIASKQKFSPSNAWR